jgi:hypothetical protein
MPLYRNSTTTTAAATTAAAAYWEWHVVEGVAAGRASTEKQPFTPRQSIDSWYTPDTGLSVDGARYDLKYLKLSNILSSECLTLFEAVQHAPTNCVSKEQPNYWVSQ